MLVELKLGISISLNDALSNFARVMCLVKKQRLQFIVRPMLLKFRSRHIVLNLFIKMHPESQDLALCVS